MWFKNVHLFQFAEKFDYTAEELEQKLKESAYAPCPPVSPQTMGWVSPFSDEVNAPLVYGAEGQILFALKIEKKLLPATVVRDHVLEAIKKIERTEKRKIYKREKEGIKEEIYHTLLPRAFSRFSKIYGCIDLQKQWITVDVANRQMAELFTTHLRKTLGSLKINPPDISQPSLTMTEWLATQTEPEEISIKETCVLQNPRNEKGQVRFSQQDLYADPVQAFIKDEHFYVTQLAFNWQEHLACVMKDDFSFHQISYGESVEMRAQDILTESPDQRLATDFTIMSQTLREFLTRMFVIFADKEDEKSSKRIGHAEAVAA
jgi:recombination associated protein RdgC